MSGIPFQPGRQKIGRYEKYYYPYLYRMGQRRYAKHGRLYFRTATDALTYAIHWAARAERFIAAKEPNHVN